MIEKPAFIQGVCSFKGKGLKNPVTPEPPLTYKVSADKRCQLTYFRAGNSSAEMIYFLVKRDGVAMRYFPLGAKSGGHIALAVTEDLPPGSVIEVMVAAPEGSSGEVVVDAGFMEF